MSSHNQRGNWYFANFQTCLDKYKTIRQTETGTTVDVRPFRKQEMTHPTGLQHLLTTQRQKSKCAYEKLPDFLILLSLSFTIKVIHFFQTKQYILIYMHCV